MTRPRRRLITLLALAPLLLAASPRGGLVSAEDVPTMLARLSLAVVTVHTEKDNANTQGSGFVVDSDGVIVTAYHVVAGASHAYVILQNGTRLEVEGVVAKDPTHDVALLRVNARGDLQAVALGDSDAMRPGDRIYVLGSPQGLELTATDGIVSAPVRRSPSGRASLQITAPIFGGSSGGPAVNAAGEVVGVARAYHRDAQSLTFATPINVVKPLMVARSLVPLPLPAAAPAVPSP